MHAKVPYRKGKNCLRAAIIEGKIIVAVFGDKGDYADIGIFLFFRHQIHLPGYNVCPEVGSSVVIHG